MKFNPRAPAAQILAAIAATPSKTTVYVAPAQAHLFRRVPNDGRTYIVQDPTDRRVLHWTTNGTYERVDTSKLTVKVQRCVRGAKRATREQRIAGRDALIHVRVTKPHAPPMPEICLIDLQRVMLICGFKKSFIYERTDFPKPIRLGTAQRSAVRWIEGEILAWVRAQVTARTTASA